MFCLIHPSLSLINHLFVGLNSLRKFVFKDTELQIHQINDLHLSSSELLPPFLKLVLYLLLDFILPRFEHSIVSIIGLHASHLELL